MTNVKVARTMNGMFPKREIPFTDENVKKRIQRFFEMSPNVPMNCANKLSSGRHRAEVTPKMSGCLVRNWMAAFSMRKTNY